MTTKITTLALTAILFCCNSICAGNATWTWTGNAISSDWTDKSNWSTSDPDATVGSTDTVIINNGASVYPFLLGDVTIGTFTMNGGWMYSNGYLFETLNVFTMYGGQFRADNSIITSTDLYIYGGSLYMQGNRIDVSDDVVIDGGLLSIICNNVVIPDDLFIPSGTLDLNGYDLFVTDEYTYTGSNSIVNAGDVTITNLVVDFAGADTLDYNISIVDYATFIDGIIRTSSTSMLVFEPKASATGMSDASHVNGPVKKLFGASGNHELDMPVGDGTVFATLTVSHFINIRAQDYFIAEYFNEIPPYNASALDNTLDHISAAEYWTLDRGTSSGTATTGAHVRLSFDETTRSGPIDYANDLRVTWWNGTIWKDYGAANRMGNNVAGTLRSATRFTNFGTFTLGSTTSFNPMPVLLLDFQAKAVEKNVHISWSTTSELNNDFFTVQKCLDGKSWSVIGIVDGAGNSDQVSNYNFTDRSPANGVQYYRLIQTDLDGQSTTSHMVAITFIPGIQVSMDLFPNPANSFVNIKLSEPADNASITVFNSTGMKVMELTSQSGHSFDLDLAHLEHGLYTIEVRDEKGISFSKILKN